MSLALDRMNGDRMNGDRMNGDRMHCICACLNNSPEPLPNDTLGGQRFQCYYCKFKWRIIEIFDKVCSDCSMTLEKNVCRFCHKTYNQDTKKVFVYW